MFVKNIPWSRCALAQRHLHIIAANLEDDDLEVERSIYENSRLIPLKNQAVCWETL